MAGGGERRREEAWWTLDEVAARVALALSVDYDGQPSGRVRDVPDGRVVRYYTTLGLVDRPLRYEGRVALYGARHLRQIVAIKRLQAKGRSLSEIQQTLLALDDRGLERLAAVPEEALAEVVRPPAEERGEAAAGTTRRDERHDEREEVPARRFWSAAPAPAITGAETRPKGEPGARVAGTLTGVPISPDVVLLAAFSRPPDAEDVEALRAAAAPLLAVLKRRDLL